MWWPAPGAVAPAVRIAPKVGRVSWAKGGVLVLELDIPHRGALRLEHAVFDLNGTLALDGALLPGVREAARAVAAVLPCLLLTADTFGTGAAMAHELGFAYQRVANGDEKQQVVRELSADAVVAVGNGQNDAAMFRAAALAIAVLGPEGAASAALQAAHLVAPSALYAMELLLSPSRLVATLRG